jgi:hypothetical protein
MENRRAEEILSGDSGTSRRGKDEGKVCRRVNIM